jgi:hypothetical protein
LAGKKNTKIANLWIKTLIQPKKTIIRSQLNPEANSDPLPTLGKSTKRKTPDNLNKKQVTKDDTCTLRTLENQRAST